MHLGADCLGNSKMALNFSRHSGFKVVDQNSQNIVLVNNSRTPWPT